MKSPLHLFRLNAVIIAVAFSASLFHSQSHSASENLPSTSVEVFQALENRLCKADAERDQFTLELLLDPDFIDISPAGVLTTRNQDIANVLRSAPDLSSVSERVTNARVVGTVAVVVGTYFEQQHGKDQPAQTEGAFMHVYSLERGNWICISSQRTPIIKPMELKEHHPKKQRNHGHLPSVALPLPSQ